MIAELRDGGAIHLSRNGAQELFGERHQVFIVGVCLIELEHGELRIVLSGDALVAEVAIDLIDALEPADHQTLEIKLGRDAKVEIHVERVVVSNEGTCDGTPSDRLHHRSFDFHVFARVEESADGSNHLSALDEDAAHIRVHGHVDVALAIAKLDVGKPMPLLGQR